MYVKKFTSFCQALKKMHTKENWFLFLLHSVVCEAGSIETVERPSVRLSVPSHQSPAAAACGGFAAEHPANRRYRWTAGAGAQQQRRRGRCGQCRVDSRGTRLLLGEIVADVAQLVIGETHLSSSGRSLSKPVFLALPFLPVTRIKSQMNAAWMLRCCAAPCRPHLSRLQRLHSNQRPTAELN